MNVAPKLLTLLSLLALFSFWSCDGQLDQLSGAKEEEQGETNIGSAANTNDDDDDDSEDGQGSGGGFGKDFFKDGFDYHRVPIPAEQGDSKGSGGSKGATDGTYNHDGKSAPYSLYVPQDNGSKAHPVFVYFHGDGGGSANTSLVNQVGSNHPIIAFAMGTPTGDSWWVDQGPKNSDFFMSFIEDKLQKEYNVDRSRIYLAGSSGGANFQTGMILPRHGYKYAMTSINLCGGAQNMLEFFEFTKKFPKGQMFTLFATKGIFWKSKLSMPSNTIRNENLF
jgi:hypothetical protein